MGLDATPGDGDGYAYGDGYGDGDGYAYGDGYGYGRGDGYGHGSGYAYGDGYGYGRGDGYGDGYGYGDGHSYGHGDGDGDGYGYGDGYGHGHGYGYGYGSGHDEWIRAYLAAQSAAQPDGDRLVFWRCDEAGQPANGGSRMPTPAPGVIHRTPGPLRLCAPGTLHATRKPEVWEGNQCWLVRLHGEIIGNDDKLGCLVREFVERVW